MNVRGVSFHIGSGSTKDNSPCYDKTLETVQRVFEIGTELGFKMDTVDIGGGQNITFGAKVASVVSEWRAKFPAGVRWMFEPGRCICKPVQTVACRVIGTRKSCINVDDGVHGSFSGVMQENSALSKDSPITLDGQAYDVTALRPVSLARLVTVWTSSAPT